MDNFLPYFEEHDPIINLMTERIKLNLLFKLSNLNSNFALTLGYLNPALNNPALVVCNSVWSQELQLHYVSVCIFKYSFSYGNDKQDYNFVRNYIWPSMTSLVPRTFTISIFLLFNWKKMLQSKNWGEHVCCFGHVSCLLTWKKW